MKRYYHIWFQTKFKKFMLVDDIDNRIHALLGEIATDKGIDLLAAGSLPDHMHLLVGLESERELPAVVKTFKGISSRRIFQEFTHLKHDFKTNNFWARRYCAKEVPEKALRSVVNYINEQKKDLYVL
jgi:putative transposase